MAKLILRITRGDRELLEGKTAQEFGESGGTIGRGVDNDMQLPDPDCYISSRHASIQYKNNAFYLTDTSVNGVYIDGARTPIGRQNQVLMTDGMVIGIGDYELCASIAEAVVAAPSSPAAEVFDDPFADCTIRPAVQEGPSGDADFFDSLDPVAILDDSPPPPEAPRTSSVEYQALSAGFFTDNAYIPAGQKSGVTAEEDDAPAALSSPADVTPVIDIPEEWDQTSFSLTSGRAADDKADAAYIPEEWDRTDYTASFSYNGVREEVAAENSEPLWATAGRTAPAVEKSPWNDAVSAAVARPGAEQPVLGTTRVPVEVSARETSSQPAAPARSDGLEYHVKEVLAGMGLTSSDEDAVRVGREWLTAMPSILEGLINLLRVRAEIKSQLRADKTSIQVDENNPLKFSNSAAVAVDNLFLHPRQGFLDSHTAFLQVLEDLVVHQKAMASGVQGGLEALVDRLSPQAIETKTQQQKTNRGLLAKLTSQNNWQTYCQTYDFIMKNSSSSFLDVFGDEFVSAYEKMIADHKRQNSDSR